LRGIVGVLAGLASFGGAAGALAGLGGALSYKGVTYWLDLFTHLAPIWLAAGLAGLVLWLLAGRPGWLSPAAGALAVVASLIVMAPELIAASRPPPPISPGVERLRLLQFNLWKDNVDPAATIAYIRKVDADVVTFEETYDNMFDTPDRLADLYPYRAAHLPYNGYSVAILSKVPLEDVVTMPVAPGVRARLHTRSGRPFELIAVHYRWPTALFQIIQSRRLSAEIAKLSPRTTIVVGDFNLTPWSFTLRRQDRRFGLQRRTRALWSWPARTPSGAPFPVPFLPIDQLYAGTDWRTVSVERGPRQGSDHYPVIVTLAYAP
jgi:endonuclease/exonuclease/phosphatase (EEP) superfamily protein YafD